jgi:transcription termination factor Rho
MSSGVVSLLDLQKLGLKELFGLVQKIGDSSSLSKAEAINMLLVHAIESGDQVYGGGVLDIVNQNTAYVRSQDSNYLSGPNDTYVSHRLITKHGLKSGHFVEGVLGFVDGKKKLSMQSIVRIQGCEVGQRKRVIDFDALTPDFPTQKIKLEVENSGCLSCRILDLLVPMGFGQRALIVAPPKSGKTVLMQNIARAIEINHPDAKLMVLLVDERPEEVTDMIRSVRAEVISSNFDKSAEDHVRVVEVTLNRAKRYAEEGHHAVILLDSLTRLARAYNVLIPNSGRVLSGGMDINAMQKPKKFFGAARNLQGAGSITIIATVLVDTGSKMDQLIKEELKGRGNSEVVLDRRFAELGIFPAIDLSCSSTRKDILIEGFPKKLSTMIRNSLASKKPEEAAEILIKKIGSTRTNRQLLSMLGGTDGEY